MRGVFVALEGIDGSGKSSAAREIADSLRGEGHDVVLTREPGGTEAGSLIRSLILDSRRQLAPETELLLMCADRAEHVETVIKPALERGAIVVTDRFAASTRAYQGYGLGLAASMVDAAIAVATGGLCPDLTVLFDLDPRVAHARRTGDRENVNALDTRDLAYRTRVREGFLEMAHSSDTWRIVDASQPLQTVIADARECVLRTVAARLAAT